MKILTEDRHWLVLGTVEWIKKEINNKVKKEGKEKIYS